MSSVNRILFPFKAKTPPIPGEIAFKDGNRSNDDSPDPFFLLPEHALEGDEDEDEETVFDFPLGQQSLSDGQIESGDDDRTLHRSPIGRPERLFRCVENAILSRKMMTELRNEGKKVCYYCRKENCPDRFDVGFTRYKMEEDGIFQDVSHDQDEDEIKGNAERRQIFYELYWKLTRNLYETERWTPADFMYLPKCIKLCARDLFPAPMDRPNVTFSDVSVEERCNRGLLPLSPVSTSTVDANDSPLF